MIDYDLSTITTVVFDVDGVLSCNTIGMNAHGVPLRTVNIKDGYAIQLAIKCGLRLAIISGGKDEAVRYRYERLGMSDVYLGCGRKADVYERYKATYGLNDSEIAFVGDDIPDYEVMRRVALPCCPCDAAQEIIDISRYVSPKAGGHGCGRDIIEQILKAKGLWLDEANAFGW